ncbi:MAG TPA: alpha/beta fold hydrolase, partial [Salinimicrobium sp.]|nr:alpha/beta fold hydrolase [Salinimicrobium sp.]
IEKIHLVVHDMGGPIGFAFAAKNINKMKSLTILNTWIDVVNFSKPWFMQTLETPVIGEAELKLITHKTWAFMFDSIGIHNAAMVPETEKEAYVDILKYRDNGQAFLKIIRNYDKSPEFRDLCFSAVQNVPYPVQAIWGAEDPSLTINRYGKEIAEIANLESVEPLYSKHLLQEEVWEALSLEIDEFIKK